MALLLDRESYDRSKKGLHCAFDHDNFPDRRIVVVTGRPFFVSASYLSIRSAFFRDIFNGTDDTRSRKEFKLDEHDSELFADILDLVYPYEKRLLCCSDGSGRLERILPMAFRLQLTELTNRIIQEKASFGGHCEKMLNVIAEEAPDNFHTLIIPLISTARPIKNSPVIIDESDLSTQALQLYRKYKNSSQDDDSVISPLYACHKEFPDAVTVQCGQCEIVVSASSFALHSRFFYNEWYGSKQVMSEEGERKFTENRCSYEVFEMFCKAVAGLHPNPDAKHLPEFLGYVKKIDAPFIYSLIEDKIMKQCFSNDENGRMMRTVLISHYVSIGEKTNSNNNMRILSRYPEWAKVTGVSADVIDDDHSGTLHVIVIVDGRKAAFYLPSFSISVWEFNEMIQIFVDVAPENIRIMYDGRTFDDKKQLVDCGMKDGDTVHVIFRDQSR